MLECHLLLGVALRSLVPLLGLSCVLLCLLAGGLLGGRLSFPGLTLRLLAAGVRGALLARHCAVCGLLGTRSGSSVAFRWSGVAREWLLRYVVMLEGVRGWFRGSFNGGLLGRFKCVDPVCSVGEARLKMVVDTTVISVVLFCCFCWSCWIGVNGTSHPGMHSKVFEACSIADSGAKCAMPRCTRSR